MALLNTAYYLHARGRHVLIVDLDLEAPGLSGFLRRAKELEVRKNGGDVMDVLSAVVRTAKTIPPSSNLTFPDLKLEDYLSSVDHQHYTAAVLKKAPRARLDVLIADERDYAQRLSALDLASMSPEQIALASDVLRGVLLQHHFPFRQPWQKPGEPPEETRYDYILVDSRTGLTEIGGLCVGPLSDRLVVVCGLNGQNIDGTRQFLNIVGLEPKSRPADAKPWDDADTSIVAAPRPASIGPKPTLLVASPVPGGDLAYKRRRMKVLRNAVGLDPVKLSYHPQMALMETVFVRDYPDEYLALEYATLGDRLMGMIGDTNEQLRAPIAEILRLRRPEIQDRLETLELPRRLARIALAGDPTDLGISLLTSDRFQASARLKDRIRIVGINLAATDEQEAQLRLSWADELDSEEARESGDSGIIRSIEERFSEAVSFIPRFYQAYNNWGMVLHKWSNSSVGYEADKLSTEAIRKFKHATAIKPDYYEAWYNLGNALSDRAKMKEGKESDDLFKEAFKKYGEALRIAPDYHEAFHHWGNALADQAAREQGPEGDELFNQAFDKYDRALTIKPDNFEVLRDWALAATKRAKSKEGQESVMLLALADEKYRRAIQIKPGQPELLTLKGVLGGHENPPRRVQEVADSLLKSLSLGPHYALQQAAEKVARTLRVENCVILVRPQGKEVLEIEASFNPYWSSPAVQVTIPIVKEPIDGFTGSLAQLTEPRTFNYQELSEIGHAGADYRIPYLPDRNRRVQRYSALAVPIFDQQGRLMSLLKCENKCQPGKPPTVRDEFTPEDLAAAAFLARRIRTIIEVGSVSQAKELFNVSGRLVQVMHGGLDMLQEDLLQECLRIFGADTADIAWWSAAKGDLIWARGSNPVSRGSAKNGDLVAEKCMTRHVFESVESDYAIIDDCNDEEQRHRYDYLAANPQTRSEIALRIEMEGVRTGVINLESVRKSAFDDYTAECLRVLAKHAGLAIQMVRTEGLFREAAGIRGNDQTFMQPLLDTVLEVSGFDEGIIYWLDEQSEALPVAAWRTKGEPPEPDLQYNLGSRSFASWIVNHAKTHENFRGPEIVANVREDRRFDPESMTRFDIHGSVLGFPLRFEKRPVGCIILWGRGRNFSGDRFSRERDWSRLEDLLDLASLQIALTQAEQGQIEQMQLLHMLADRFPVVPVMVCTKRVEKWTLDELIEKGLPPESPKFTIRYVNTRWCEFMGVSDPPEVAVYGKTDWDFFPPKHAREYYDKDLKVFEGDEIVEQLQENVHPINGKIRKVAIWKSPIKSERSKKPIGIFISYVDRTHE